MKTQQDNLWQRELFVLASGSATRRAMLKNAGLDFIADASDVDEDSIKKSCKASGASVTETAEALALAKAKKISAERKGMLVLGCDQMLECEGRWLDKAGDERTARDQLTFLSGKTHQLISAAVLLRDGKIIWKKTETAMLHMRALSPEFIDAYCAQMGDGLLASVGCYALEGLGSQLFERVEGNHFVILGLPLLAFLDALRQEEVLLR
ncbi:MAG: septum formation protein Maf [Alphaproteobacteria bacterium]|nr:septum formation protein Maf [Alphaproteobacteria bacterium]